MIINKYKPDQSGGRIIFNKILKLQAAAHGRGAALYAAQKKLIHMNIPYRKAAVVGYEGLIKIR